MNTSQPPFDDPHVRQAVNYALDRQSIVDAALFGAGVPAGPLSPALEAWARDVSEFPCYEHSPERARALLEEAGVEMPVRVTMLVLPRQDIRDIAQVAQAQLNAAGFEVELDIPELGQFVQASRRGRHRRRRTKKPRAVAGLFLGGCEDGRRAQRLVRLNRPCGPRRFRVRAARSRGPRRFRCSSCPGSRWRVFCAACR